LKLEPFSFTDYI